MHDICNTITKQNKTTRWDWLENFHQGQGQLKTIIECVCLCLNKESIENGNNTGWEL